MGSWAFLRIGDLTLASTKGEVDPTVLMLFTESDKRVREAQLQNPEIDEPCDVPRDEMLEADTFVAVEYVASLSVVKDRLEFMGFTLSVAREEFDRALKEQLDEIERRGEDPSWKTQEILIRAIEKERQVLRELSFESWLEAFALILERKLRPDRAYWFDDESNDLPVVVRFVLGNSFGEGLWFPSYDFRVFMRAAVEVTGVDAEVTYDLADLAAGEDVSHDEDLCGWARRETAQEFVLNHKIIVLTEGSSDAAAIEGCLRLFYPHLTEYYSFMDFHGVRAPGGAASLVAMIKAFVGAGVVNRIIAMFDNDTAAHSALRCLRDVELPANIRVLYYPDLEIARHYPTLGPQGVVSMNVNGLAGGLELYFGLDVLRRADGGLIEVQWRGYNEALKQYQGEVTHKGQLQERFAAKVKACLTSPSAIADYDWTGMKLIIERLRTAFHDHTT